MNGPVIEMPLPRVKSRRSSLSATAVDVGGVNPWQLKWTPTHGRITIAHPECPVERHLMSTYAVPGPDGPVAFAAGEFSNGVWGFFVPC